MWLSGARAPIKRLRLMPEDIAHCALRTYETNRERVGLVVARRRHRKTYHDAGAHIEFPRRQHQQGCTSFVSLPTCGLQSIQIMSPRLGLQERRPAIKVPR